jgi:hypothetical protein
MVRRASNFSGPKLHCVVNEPGFAWCPWGRAEHGETPLFEKNALTQERSKSLSTRWRLMSATGPCWRELQHAYIERVVYYRSKMGGSLSLEEAHANAYHACKDEEEAKRIYDKMMSYPLDRLDFIDLYERGE